MTSQLHYSNCSGIYDQVELSVPVMVIWSLAAVFVFIINLVIVLALICNRFLRKRKTVPVLSLGIADMLIGLVAFPIHIIGSKMRSMAGINAEPYFSCRITSSIMCFLLTSAMLNVLLLTLDRVFLVLYPIRYRVYMTAKKMAGAVSIVWGLSLLVGLLAYFSDYMPRRSHLLYFVCEQHGINRMLTITLTCIIASVLFCLIFFYAIIVYSVVTNRKKIVPQASSSSVSSQGKSTSGNLTSIHRVVGTERKLTITSILVVSLCFVMWTPHVTLSVYQLLYGCTRNVSHWIYVITTTLALLNSGSNGLLYAVRIQIIRKGILAIICCKCNKAELNHGQSTPSSRFVPSPIVSMSPAEKRELCRVGRFSNGTSFPSPTLFKAAVTNHWQVNLKSRSPHVSPFQRRVPTQMTGELKVSPLAT